MGDYTLIIYLAIIFVVFYFFLIRPQKKKDKDISRMRRHLTIGDEVTTIGGMTGRIVKVSDDDVVIETGTARTKITIKKWGIASKESGAEIPADDKGGKKAIKEKAESAAQAPSESEKEPEEKPEDK